MEKSATENKNELQEINEINNNKIPLCVISSLAWQKLALDM